jgi:signal transduction histidine kinase
LAIAVAWRFSGRVTSALAAADTSVAAAAAERQSRLEEVVHELRTPLAVMGTNLELASMDDPDATRYVDAARRAVDRMARTVDDLAGHGGLAVERHDGPVDLGAIAASIVEEQVGPGHALGVHLLAIGADRVMVPGADPAALRTSLGNLLSNALRYAPRGSTIAVDWGDHDGWGWLSVTDEGPGIPVHLHGRVFERGWQGAHDRERGSSGEGGLGLAITRQLTESQGGVVTVDSDEGNGATFAIWLPTRDHVAATVTTDGVHAVLRPWAQTRLPA